MYTYMGQPNPSSYKGRVVALFRRRRQHTTIARQRPPPPPATQHHGRSQDVDEHLRTTRYRHSLAAPCRGRNEGPPQGNSDESEVEEGTKRAGRGGGTAAALRPFGALRSVGRARRSERHRRSILCVARGENAM